VFYHGWLNGPQLRHRIRKVPAEILDPEGRGKLGGGEVLKNKILRRMFGFKITEATRG
jgi:hypothetical protein